MIRYGLPLGVSLAVGLSSSLSSSRALADVDPPPASAAASDGKGDAPDPAAPRSSSPSLVDLDRWRFFAHVDVVPFINDGFAGYLAVKPPGLSRWELGVGAYGFHQPNGFVKLTAPSNDGLGVREWVATAFARYFFGLDPMPHFGTTDTDTRGVFVTGYLGYERKVVQLAGAFAVMPPGPSSIGIDEGLLGVDVGYHWLPFGKTFFLAPSVGAIVTPKLGGPSSVGGRGYTEPPLSPIFFVSVGVQI